MKYYAVVHLSCNTLEEALEFPDYVKVFKEKELAEQYTEFDEVVIEFEEKA